MTNDMNQRLEELLQDLLAISAGALDEERQAAASKAAELLKFVMDAPEVDVRSVGRHNGEFEVVARLAEPPAWDGDYLLVRSDFGETG